MRISFFNFALILYVVPVCSLLSQGVRKIPFTVTCWNLTVGPLVWIYVQRNLPLSLTSKVLAKGERLWVWPAGTLEFRPNKHPTCPSHTLKWLLPNVTPEATSPSFFFFHVIEKHSHDIHRKVIVWWLISPRALSHSCVYEKQINVYLNKIKLQMVCAVLITYLFHKNIWNVKVQMLVGVHLVLLQENIEFPVQSISHYCELPSYIACKSHYQAFVTLHSQWFCMYRSTCFAE